MLLQVQQLSKRFGDVTALSEVSFSIAGPGFVGILGPNGAGKSTLLDILQGLAAPSSGSVRLFGKAAEPYPRSRVGVVLQKEVQLERCSAREYADLFAAIHGVAQGGDKILASAALEHRAAVPLAQLSGGEAARLFIWTALVNEPDLLFLDEPTAALDPETKRDVGAMLRKVATSRCVVMTTHDLREADGLFDELVFLVGGRVRASGTRDELIAAVPEASRTNLGVEAAFFHFCGGQPNKLGLAREEPV
jgi:ABC-2 type transport system ATP-binding protein